MKKVILFACIEKNIGDDLFVYLVAKRYPEISFYITSDAKYGTLADLPNLIFDDQVSRWIRASNSISHNPIKELYRNIILNKIGKRIGRFDIAIYIVGNAFKNNDYQGRKDSRWFVDRLSLADSFYLLSTNFGPYKDDRWRNDFFSVFNLATDVCFRDRKSYDLFSVINNVRYCPDAVISLGKQRHLSNDYILVSVIDCSLPGRPENVRNLSYSYERKMIEIVDYYVKKGKRIVLLNANTIQDNAAAVRIFQQVNNKEMVDIFNYNGDLNTVFELFERAECTIATRLHTIILSWLYNIPVLPIVYDEKVAGILDSCRFNEKAIDIRRIDDLIVEEMSNVMCRYSFQLKEEVIMDSNRQFMKLDAALKNSIA